MIADAVTIMRKEWRELLLHRGNLRGGWLSLLLMIGVFGIYMPSQFGRSWVEAPQSLVVWFWVPLFLLSSVVADSFAGERERHTLETLLASRLSDRSILLGKIGAAVGYAWGLTLVMLLLGVITVNVLFGQGRLIFFAPWVFVGILALTFLAALLVACVGVLVSLRASTVRQAAQTLSIAIMLLLFVPVFGLQLLPDDVTAQLVASLAGLDLATVVIGVGVALAALDVVFLLVVMARFRRSRLILD